MGWRAYFGPGNTVLLEILELAGLDESHKMLKRPVVGSFSSFGEATAGKFP